MNVKQMGWRLLLVLTLVGLLAGCSSPTATIAPTAAPPVAPTAAATVDLQPTFNAIKTQSAATVIANLTQKAPSATPVAPATAAATATSPATATQPPLPTSTPAASSTPLSRATATATAALIPWTLVPTKAAYSCIVTDFSPKASVSYPPSSNFDVHWVVTNTGTQKWLASETIFRYVDGVKMQKKGDFALLGIDVAPNESYDVGLDMVAPATAGTYHITWRLSYGNVSICSMNLTVVIK